MLGQDLDGPAELEVRALPGDLDRGVHRRESHHRRAPHVAVVVADAGRGHELPVRGAARRGRLIARAHSATRLGGPGGGRLGTATFCFDEECTVPEGTVRWFDAERGFGFLSLGDEGEDLFVHASELTEIPADLAPGPHRAALELANKATFTRDELDAYRKVIDEIQQAEELAEARWAEGKAEGKVEGIAEGELKGILKGKAEAILAVLTARGIAISAAGRARIEACKDLATLDRWLARAIHAASVEEVFASSAQDVAT